jgi:hypothetical protein
LIAFRGAHSKSLPLFLVVHDINVLALSFSCCSFSHVLRFANALAHSLVAWAPFYNSLGLGTIPISTPPTHVLLADLIDGYITYA